MPWPPALAEAAQSSAAVPCGLQWALLTASAVGSALASSAVSPALPLQQLSAGSSAALLLSFCSEAGSTAGLSEAVVRSALAAAAGLALQVQVSWQQGPAVAQPLQVQSAVLAAAAGAAKPRVGTKMTVHCTGIVQATNKKFWS